MIKLSTPVTMPSERLIPEDTYLLRVEKLESKQSANNSDKQILHITVAVCNDGENKGATFRDVFSINDEVGRGKFAMFYSAVNPKWDGTTPISEIDETKIVGCKFYGDVGSRKLPPKKDAPDDADTKIVNCFKNNKPFAQYKDPNAGRAAAKPAGKPTAAAKPAAKPAKPATPPADEAGTTETEGTEGTTDGAAETKDGEWDG